MPVYTLFHPLHSQSLCEICLLARSNAPRSCSRAYRGAAYRGASIFVGDMLVFPRTNSLSPHLSRAGLAAPRGRFPGPPISSPAARTAPTTSRRRARRPAPSTSGSRSSSASALFGCFYWHAATSSAAPRSSPRSSTPAAGSSTLACSSGAHTSPLLTTSGM